MLHEILLSLSGHPSPLLRTAQAAHAHVDSDDASSAPASSTLITPPERALLSSLARLSDLHVRLRSFGAQVAASHPSAICRAAAAAVEGTHLAAFQREVLRVEEGVLRVDAGLVGAYNVVPLTAVVGEFSGWTRRMEWLWVMVQFMLEGSGEGLDGESGEVGGEGRETGKGVKTACTGAALIDWLRGELQTGYEDVEQTARSLVRVAETAWVKQVAAWVLYGRLPGFGAEDFFIRRAEDADEEFVCVSSLLPSFVSPATAASMLFIGRSLNHIRSKGSLDGTVQGMDHLSSQLRELSRLTYPLDSATLARTITDIRLYLSRHALQKLLPLTRVLDILQLLRDFFLLGRGEFAMALTQQADDKIRSRWRRADNLAHEKRDGLGHVVVKEGEVIAVLSRTWAAMGSMQGQQTEEDEGLELARDLLKLTLVKTPPKTPTRLGSTIRLAATPYSNLMFSVPVTLSLNVPSPLDLFLSPSDVHIYTTIHSYLHSIRRAHLRLMDLWKITSLRRHYPPPPKPAHGSSKAGRARVILLRERQARRMLAMRSAWTTCSAAIFFLGETEGYLQVEVVAGLWEGFRRWLTTGSDDPRPPESARPSRAPSRIDNMDVDAMDEDGDDDMWLAEGAGQPRLQTVRREARHPHDPQSLAAAHRLYLSTLVRRLLLSEESFTDPLYNLLVEIDQIVALVHRLQEVWNAIDLEEDVGVVDAFVDLEKEERDIRRQIEVTVARIKDGIEGMIGVLRNLEADHEGLIWADDDAGESGSGGLRDEGQYVPRRVGGVDRLLMKLDFGSWFDSGKESSAEAARSGQPESVAA